MQKSCRLSPRGVASKVVDPNACSAPEVVCTKRMYDRVVCFVEGGWRVAPACVWLVFGVAKLLKALKPKSLEL